MKAATKISRYTPPKSQLLKWVGNKHKFAVEISNFFPKRFGTFYEPFLGSGAILATVSPQTGVGSDIFAPLMEIWETLKDNPAELVEWYAQRRDRLETEDRVEVYNTIRASFNRNHNGADFLYLSRACYGGVIRFRKSDGFMSTPCGVHTPIPVKTFNARVQEWRQRIANVDFYNVDYKEIFKMARPGDLIYCDPPYSHSQSILYGAQSFILEELLAVIQEAKNRGVYIALSIDGKKKSGKYLCDLPIPDGLFEQEHYISIGRSMLKRFQMEGQSLEAENVSDRLLLSYRI